MHMSPTTRQRQQPRSGFTLTEMLVATGLVVLIMLMFAQIYAVAIGTLREQRGLAQNDQKARIVSNMLRSDLQNMTYRQPGFPYGDVQGIVAMSPGDGSIVDPVNQRGFFYYSENDPNLDTDDVLQFTVQVGRSQRGDAETKSAARAFQGRAAGLGGAFVNQPSNDFGSNAAEVTYFLRNGRLYRRVLLIRDPLARRPKADPQPSDPSNGDRRFDSGSPNYTADVFYRDFDYSATRSNGVVWFNSVESLDNSKGTRNIPIALPQNRFGFYNQPGDMDVLEQGQPKEFSPAGRFFGRPTLEECSDTTFAWPGVSPGGSVAAFKRTEPISFNADGVIDLFDDDSNRIGEDILMTNVEAFDIKVLDNEFGDFVSLGDSDSQTFANSRRRNAQFGPNTTVANNRVIDTWHPNAFVTNEPAPGSRDITNTFLNPPHQSLWHNVNGETVGAWAASSSPTFDYIQVPALNFTFDGNRNSRSLLYKRISGGTTGTVQPELPPVPGTIVQDGGVRWQCVDNRVGIKAIQITIRFRDTTSNIPRQLTLVHSFVE